jgi:hypothetical protein
MVIPLFFSTLFMGSAVLLGYYIVGRRDASLFGRLPSLLELSAPLLLLGLAVLPEALPSVFASILHHPIVSDYVQPIQAGGVQVTETWVMARWWTPIGGILYAFVGVGIIGAVWNIFRSHDRKLNVCALCIGLMWLGLGAFSSLRFLPL